MQNSHSKLINEIAQSLDCGLDCYFNSETSELICVPADLEMVDDEECLEFYKQDLRKVTNQDFRLQEVPSSRKLRIFQNHGTLCLPIGRWKAKVRIRECLAKKETISKLQAPH